MDQVTFRSDTVLSDVHLLLPNTRHLMVRLNAVGQPVFVSRFRILPGYESSCGTPGEKDRAGEGEEEERDLAKTQNLPEALLDEDGDLDVVRRPRDSAAPQPDLRARDRVNPVILSRGEDVNTELLDEEECSDDTIKIEHTMATPLEDVGKQVWRGALLMSDFILSQPELFRGSTVLELGAGMGLTSLVMATVAKRVYCTDVGHDLLGMCQRNVTLNKSLLESAGGEVKVRELDWTRDDFNSDWDSEFGWSEDEIADLHDRTTVLIAADVCYDEDLTDSLFRTLYRVTSNLPKPSTIYMSIEKRLNFTIQHLDVSCEAYDHFRRCLRDLGHLTDSKMTFSVEQVETHFLQFLEYERVEQLVKSLPFIDKAAARSAHQAPLEGAVVCIPLFPRGQTSVIGDIRT